MSKESNKEVTSQGLSIASLVLGIISIVVSFAGFLSGIPGVLAIIFGAVSLKSPGRKKSIAGIITGSIGIVLSILIVVIVLTALPALQTNQRDTMRKSDVSRLVSDVTSYRSNNRGQLPATSDLLNANFLQITSVTDVGLPTTSTAIYDIGASCGGAEISARSYSVTILLESGSTYCLDS
jgi:hypothetical protein